MLKRICRIITIWGRANSVNVQKVLWCCDELVLPYERIDAGMQFGRNNEPEYLAMNPNARVPTLVDGDFVLWESNSILRYLVMQYAPASPLYPPEPRQRASIDRWLDWSLSTLQPAERPVFWALVDAHLQGRFFLEGEKCSLADLVIGAYAKRWFGLEGIERLPLPNLERWYSRLATRAGFKKYVDFPLT
jgi:glutathione S-transferase